MPILQKVRNPVYPAEGTGCTGDGIPCGTSSYRGEGIRHRRRFPEGTSCGQCDPRGQQILQLYFYIRHCRRIRSCRGQEPHRTVKGHQESGWSMRECRRSFLKDSVAVTKFIYWLKNSCGQREITEVTAADYLEQKRREIPEFLDLSFPTIAGYKSNAAMMHYEATRTTVRFWSRKECFGRFRRTVSGRYHRCNQNHRFGSLSPKR